MPEVAVSPSTAKAYGKSGRSLYFDETRLAWVSAVVINGRTYIAFDEASGFVSKVGRDIRIEEA